MLIFGIIVGLIGGGLFLLSKKQKKASQAMAKTKALPVNQLTANSQVEVQGTVKADGALKTPSSQQDCVYYEYEVQKQTRRQDNEGHWETDWETVEEDKQSVPFFISDQTGQVRVNPEGGSIEAQDLGERSFHTGDRDIISAFKLDRHDFFRTGTGNARLTEKALLVNQPAYVYGFLTESGAGREIKKGKEGLTISYRSEEEVEKTTKRSATVMKVLGWIGIILGIILIIASFAK